MQIKKHQTIILAFIILTVLLGLVFVAFNRNSPKPDAKNQTTGSTSSPINYNPPSAEEKKASDDQKQSNVARTKTDASPTVDDSAAVVISDASQYDDVVEVRAYITSLYDEAGTCTATFTKDGQTVSVENPAFKDAKTTQCGALNIARQKFSSGGNWQLSVTYTSGKISGSASRAVTLK